MLGPSEPPQSVITCNTAAFFMTSARLMVCCLGSCSVGYALGPPSRHSQFRDAAPLMQPGNAVCTTPLAVLSTGTLRSHEGDESGKNNVDFSRIVRGGTGKKPAGTFWGRRG